MFKELKNYFIRLIESGDENETITEYKETKNVDRRKFLKQAGLGVAGLGALTAIPNAAGFRIRSEDGVKLSRNQQAGADDYEQIGSLEENLVNSGGWAPGLNGQ